MNTIHKLAAIAGITATIAAHGMVAETLSSPILTDSPIGVSGPLGDLCDTIRDTAEEYTERRHDAEEGNSENETHAHIANPYTVRITKTQQNQG